MPSEEGDEAASDAAVADLEVEPGVTWTVETEVAPAERAAEPATGGNKACMADCSVGAWRSLTKDAPSMERNSGCLESDAQLHPNAFFLTIP